MVTKFKKKYILVLISILIIVPLSISGAILYRQSQFGPLFFHYFGSLDESDIDDFEVTHSPYQNFTFSNYSCNSNSPLGVHSMCTRITSMNLHEIEILTNQNPSSKIKFSNNNITVLERTLFEIKINNWTFLTAPFTQYYSNREYIGGMNGELLLRTNGTHYNLTFYHIANFSSEVFPVGDKYLNKTFVEIQYPLIYSLSVKGYICIGFYPFSNNYDIHSIPPEDLISGKLLKVFDVILNDTGDGLKMSGNIFNYFPDYNDIMYNIPWKLSVATTIFSKREDI